jgi:hypothetical protein
MVDEIGEHVVLFGPTNHVRRANSWIVKNRGKSGRDTPNTIRGPLLSEPTCAPRNWAVDRSSAHVHQAHKIRITK